MKEHLWIKSRNKNISAMLHTPEINDNNHLVVMCHGFTGEKIGGSQFYIKIAHFLEAHGFSVLRFDFVGSGESEGNFSEDTYVSGWIQDLNEIIKYIDAQKKYSKIFLLGHSLGGFIVLNHQEKITSISGIVLIAPEINPIENYENRILGQKMWAKLLDNQEVSGFFGKDLTLNPKFVKDLIKYQELFRNQINDIKCPLIIIHGSEDSAVPIQYAYQYVEEGKNKRYLSVVEGADHGFTNKSSELNEHILNFLLQ